MEKSCPSFRVVFEKRCQTRCHRVLPRWHRVLSCNVFHRNLASFSVIYLSSALKTRNLAQIPMKHVLESLKKRATSTPRKRERRNETRWHRVRPDGIGSPDAIGPIPMPLCRKRPRGIGWGDSICFSNTSVWNNGDVNEVLMSVWIFSQENHFSRVIFV